MADRRLKVREYAEELQKLHPDWPKHKCESKAKIAITKNEKAKGGTI